MPDTGTARAVVGRVVDRLVRGGVVMADDATSSPLVPRARALTLCVLARDRVRAETAVRRSPPAALALAPTVPAADRDTLVAAAWLHGIGYVTELGEAGFHSLDGARYRKPRGGPLPGRSSFRCPVRRRGHRSG